VQEILGSKLMANKLDFDFHLFRVGTMGSSYYVTATEDCGVEVGSRTMRVACAAEVAS